MPAQTLGQVGYLGRAQVGFLEQLRTGKNRAHIAVHQDQVLLLDHLERALLDDAGQVVLELRVRRDHVMYDVWAKQEYLKTIQETQQLLLIMLVTMLETLQVWEQIYLNHM